MLSNTRYYISNIKYYIGRSLKGLFNIAYYLRELLIVKVLTMLLKN